MKLRCLGRSMLLIISLVGSCCIFAETPLWTFSPLTDTTMVISPTETANVRYLIKNQSSKPRTLSMTPIQGISQDTTSGNCTNPFTLPAHGVCILNLTIAGSALKRNVESGPVVCQQGIQLQCYQPNASNSLHITVLGENTPYESYIASGKSLYQCAVTPKGQLEACNVGVTLANSNLSAVFIAAVNGTQYAYAADLAGDVLQCTLNANGSINTCTSTPSAPNWASPSSIALATVNGVQYAYVADAGANTVYKCSLNANGSFNVCNSAGPMVAPLWFPFNLAFTKVNGVQYAYIAGFTTGMFRCTLNKNGTFNNCVNTSGNIPGAFGAISVAFATTNSVQYAYVGARVGMQFDVYQCTLHTADGTLDSCNATSAVGSPNWVPAAIAFKTTNDEPYAYIGSNALDAGVSQCTLNTDGSFNTCTETPSVGTPSWIPRGIGFR